MIIVPIEENHTGLATATDRKFRAPDTSGSGLEALGAGLAKLGDGGQQFATALGEKRRRDLAAAIAAAHLDDNHQGNLDDAAVKKAYVDYSNRAASLLHGDNGILNQKGADAHAAFPAVVAALADSHDDALTSLDPILHGAIAPALGDRLRSDVARAAAHVRQQGAIEQRERSLNLQQATARDAVLHVDDPDLHDHYMATGENAIRQQGRIANLPDKDLERQLADYRSGVHADTIDALTVRDPAQAADWYARYGDNLNQSDKQRAEAALRPAADVRAENSTALAASPTESPINGRAIQLFDNDATAPGTGPSDVLQSDNQTDADTSGDKDSDPYAGLRLSVSHFPRGGALGNANFVVGGNAADPQKALLSQRWTKLNQQQRLADPNLALPAKMLEAMRAPLQNLDPRLRSKIGIAAAPAGKYVADQIVWMLEHKVLPRRIAGSSFPTANEVRLGERGAWSNDALAALHEAADRALNARQKIAWDYFTRDKFLTPEQAAGLIAALTRENNLDPDKWQNFTKNAPGYGIAQWNEHRRKMFEKFTHRPLIGSTFNEQLAFVRYELEQGEYREFGAQLRAQTDAYQAGYLTTKVYEAPAYKTREQESTKRGVYAQQVLQEFSVH